MENLNDEPNIEQYRIYQKSFQLSDNVFESDLAMSMNLDTVISTVQNDLINQKG